MRDSDFQSITRVLADPTRMDILSRIAHSNCEFACADLRRGLKITPATISHHIKELMAVDLIESRREGKFLHYSLNQSRWSAYLRELEKRVPRPEKT